MGAAPAPAGRGIATIGSLVLAAIFSQLRRTYRGVIPGVRRQRELLSLPRCFAGAVGTQNAEERYRSTASFVPTAVLQRREKGTERVGPEPAAQRGKENYTELHCRRQKNGVYFAALSISPGRLRGRQRCCIRPQTRPPLPGCGEAGRAQLQGRGGAQEVQGWGGSGDERVSSGSENGGELADGGEPCPLAACVPPPPPYSPPRPPRPGAPPGPAPPRWAARLGVIRPYRNGTQPSESL